MQKQQKIIEENEMEWTQNGIIGNLRGIIQTQSGIIEKFRKNAEEQNKKILEQFNGEINDDREIVDQLHEMQKQYEHNGQNEHNELRKIEQLKKIDQKEWEQ